jgi:hypothetical protein
MESLVCPTHSGVPGASGGLNGHLALIGASIVNGSERPFSFSAATRNS